MWAFAYKKSNQNIVRTFERRTLKQRVLGTIVYDVGTPQTIGLAFSTQRWC